jgi:hypothetical protein
VIMMLMTVLKVVIRKCGILKISINGNNIKFDRLCGIVV